MDSRGSKEVQVGVVDGENCALECTELPCEVHNARHLSRVSSGTVQSEKFEDSESNNKAGGSPIPNRIECSVQEERCKVFLSALIEFLLDADEE
jgi:hypothetical protein